MKFKNISFFLLITLLVVTFLPTLAFADNLEDDSLKLDYLGSFPAYYVFDDDCTDDFNFNNYNSDLESILNDILDRQQNGIKIIWNNDFLENFVKKDFPDTYYKIKKYNSINNMLKMPIQNNFSLYSVSKLSSDSRSETFDVTARSLLGNKLYVLESDASWSWSGSYLNDVNISSRMRSYDPLWTGGRIEDVDGKYVDNKRAYDYTVTGYIKSSLPATVGKPLLSFELVPGQGYYVLRIAGN